MTRLELILSPILFLGLVLLIVVGYIYAGVCWLREE